MKRRQTKHLLYLFFFRRKKNSGGGDEYYPLYFFYALKADDPSYQYPYIERKPVVVGGISLYYLVSSVFSSPTFYDADNFKAHRISYSSAYKLNFYRNWDAINGVYSDLVYTYEGIYFNTGDETKIYWIQPRTRMPNKADLIAPGTHPYDDPSEAFYVEIVETHDPAKQFPDATSNMRFVGYTSPPGEGDYLYTSYIVGSGDPYLPVQFIHQDQDHVTCDNAVRNEKIVGYGTRVKGNYNYTYWYLRMENTGGSPVSGSTWTVPFTNRKSGFYGSVKKYPWLKWELKTLTASVSSTRFTFTATGGAGIANGFNEDADDHIVYTPGLGEIPGWDGILAEYYCDSVTVSALSTYGSCYVLRAHSNWKKWNGHNWIAASSGDTIVNPYVSDTYTVHGLNRTRTSNQITMNSTLT